MSSCLQRQPLNPEPAGAFRSRQRAAMLDDPERCHGEEDRGEGAVAIVTAKLRSLLKTAGDMGELI